MRNKLFLGLLLILALPAFASAQSSFNCSGGNCPFLGPVIGNASGGSLKLQPTTDANTSINFYKADGTTQVFTIDTTNSVVRFPTGVSVDPPTSGFSGALLSNGDLTRSLGSSGDRWGTVFSPAINGGSSGVTITGNSILAISVSTSGAVNFPVSVTASAINPPDPVAGNITILGPNRSGGTPSIIFGLSGVGNYWKLDGGSAFGPVTDNTVDLGRTTERIRNTFTVTASAGTTSTTGSLNVGGSIYWSGYASLSSALTGAVCMSSSNLVEINTNAGGCLVSALKYKENITDIDPDDALNLVLGMKPVNYDLKENGDHQFGFIADWSPHDNMMTRDSAGEISGFRYEQYTAYLTGAIQAQQKKIEALERNQR